MKMKASAMMVKGNRLLPKSHSTFSFAKRFHGWREKRRTAGRWVI
ncbi:MAG: hypothetical protein ACLR67_00230 [Eggerthella lenta]